MQRICQNNVLENVELIFKMLTRRMDDNQIQLVRKAYELAAEAHKEQKRKTGEPYIIHPIAVARIVAEELELGANPVIAVFSRCSCCHPLPGDEVIGFKDADGKITLHKRNCPTAIRMASEQGDSIVTVNFEEQEAYLFPVRVCIRGIDRHHLLRDIVGCITEQQNLSISRLNTMTVDRIVETSVDFAVHSVNELEKAMESIAGISNVDEVSRIDIE